MLRTCLLGSLALAHAFSFSSPRCGGGRHESVLLSLAPSPAPLAPTPPSDPWFSASLASRPPPRVASLAAAREGAASLLAAAARPRRKDEAWRRTDLSALFAAQLALPSGEVAAAALEEEMEVSAGARLVLVDGAVSEELTDLSALPEGVLVGSVGSMDAVASARVMKQLETIPEADADKRTELGAYTFAALNQASLADVACIYLPPDVEVSQPLFVFMLSSGSTSGLGASHPNLVVNLDRGSSLSLVQSYSASKAADSDYFTNALTRVTLGPDSRLRHSYLQEQGLGAFHIDSVFVDVQESARYESQMVSTGARISRLNVGVSLTGSGASCQVQGLALGAETQLVDFHTFIRHASPDCQSSQEQRNAVADRARVVFRGAVVVPRGADNTTANQLCRTLLLSDTSRADIAPTLEIATDDVKCTHGATIADLDDEMIFYLQARGLGRLEARSLLLEGWARTFMSQVPSEAARRRAAVKASLLAPETGERVVRLQQLTSI
ncbi:hypothetical protein AB1Y20_007775 [Prymnesium parvum]|uniref:Fe-S cluster assembly protein SufD n=1 Tax=Prymnesium parvum TaxID=97485 RepID=A0AB34IRW6_PRYPA